MSLPRIIPHIVLSLSCVTAVDADDANYNPIEVGMTWIGNVTITKANGETAHGKAKREITGTKVINDKTYFVCVTSLEGISFMEPFTSYRRIGPEGEWSIAESDPKRQESNDLPYPITVGRTWEVPSPTGKTVYKVEALVESLVVGAEKYEKCFKISYRSEPGDLKSVFYLARGIGNISETMTSGGTTLVITHREMTKTK